MRLRVPVILLLMTAFMSGQEKWVSLFNGHDLSGWDPVGQEKWEVVDGAIHGQTVTKNYGYLQTVKKYRSFSVGSTFQVHQRWKQRRVLSHRVHPGHSGCESGNAV